MKLTALLFSALLVAPAFADSAVPFGKVLDRDAISICLIQHGDLPPFLPQGMIALQNFTVILSIATNDPGIDEYRVMAVIETSDGQRRNYYESAKRLSGNNGPVPTIVVFQLGKLRAINIASLEVVPLQKDQAKLF